MSSNSKKLDLHQGCNNNARGFSGHEKAPMLLVSTFVDLWDFFVYLSVVTSHRDLSLRVYIYKYANIYEYVI